MDLEETITSLLADHEVVGQVDEMVADATGQMLETGHAVLLAGDGAMIEIGWSDDADDA